MEARENNFNFIRDEKRIVIPFFQRAYVWKDIHWNQLLKDLKCSFLEKKEHFLGSIILKRGGVDNCSIIIDGQQRLTTFSILIKVLCDFLKEQEKNYFKDYLFENFTIDKPKINHSKLDKEKYEKVLKNKENLKDQKNLEYKDGIFGCFNYFNKEIKNNFNNIDLFEFTKYIIESKLWVIVCLNANEDEQKIFDSINSTGQKLSSTDIIKNALFDKVIKITDEDRAMQYYEKYWDSIFEKDEKEQEFWNEEIESGRVKRSKSEIFLHSYAIIKGIFNSDSDSLSNLSSLYKDYIKNLKENELKNLLSELKDYAKIYRNFPDINKETVLKYENYELRFFHIIYTYSMNTVLPLTLFLRKILEKKENIYKQCLYLLEILMMCNFETKDYNKFFSKVIKKIQKVNFDDIVNIMRIEIFDRYGKCFNKKEIEKWLTSIDNYDAKFVLFWIELYRQDKNKDYKDNTLGLNYVYTLEHLLPKSWKDNWNDIISNEEDAEKFIYQIGNMTLLKGKLNTSLKNQNWQFKLNGDGKVKNYISKNADLLINKELLDKKSWDTKEIEKRTKKCIDDFFEIWDVDIFNKNNK
ncbi:DUF262 domain-containing HNH endonuclease family protein [Campylobacter molothri]|uniref:DUF262 domain-containing protein n=1 Tax=Campylobacter molothri TaxID=1032242 RepID=A0ACC5W2N2_9BACT|nr:DUF262 domain-containing protein [Campylobacter sp. RM9760]MBZ7975192.1 DUF262 domain-containing protein [Campylobacter sp. RM9754]